LARRLESFQFYGCGEVEDIALPPDFCRGRAIFAVDATPAGSTSTST
jgi:hypothetical protein